MFVVVPQLECCCKAKNTLSDDELSTTRQWSDASSEEQGEVITCRFTNALTGDTDFTWKVKVDNQMSIGFIVNLVSFHVGSSDFHIKVGKQVWKSDDVYGKFWLCQSVHDALGAAEDGVLVVEVTKVTREEDEESMHLVLDRTFVF